MSQTPSNREPETPAAETQPDELTPEQLDRAPGGGKGSSSGARGGLARPVTPSSD